MLTSIENSDIAIVGAGRACKAFLKFLLEKDLGLQPPTILGVADKDDNAEGMRFARDKGILTTTDFRDLFRLPGLKVLIELSNSLDLVETIKRSKPSRVGLIDHIDARTMWTMLQIRSEKTEALKAIRGRISHPGDILLKFEQFAEGIEGIVLARAEETRKTERGLVESRSAISQIIDGSSIPTFVINEDHVVTHWNKACERLTGYPAAEIVGTQNQWKPFRSKKRPIMADLILDGARRKEKEAFQYYGVKWKKSRLIKDAYEVEEFFPHLGENGKWLFFTGAPIRSSDGTIIAVIETLWDRTDNKIAEEERDRHTQELSTLCSIYRDLNLSDDLETRMELTSREICNYLETDSVDIFTVEDDGTYRLRYTTLGDRSRHDEGRGPIEDEMIKTVGRNGRPVLFEDISQQQAGGGKSDRGSFRSLAYLPINTKEKQGFGVIRIAGRNPHLFSDEEKNVLDLIGNRIGAAIENRMLQEQVIRSEEKYRTIFNNVPNPIFILDNRHFKIQDINDRTLESYGYGRQELLGMPFLSLGDENDESLLLGLEKAREGESLLFTKKRHFRKGRRPFYVNITFGSAKYGDKDVILAATTDITESVEKETQLIQAGKMTTLGTMAAGMAHEINQPLNVIQVCADIFQKTIKKGLALSNKDLKTLADDISNNVQRAAGIINHMRNFSRQSESVTTAVNINDPIQDVFRVMGHQLKVHQVDLQLDLDPDLPPVLAEHNRLEQVFINLVTNAMSAMDDRGAQTGDGEWKKVLGIRSFVESDQIVVTVSDTGTGMPESVMNKIFEPFFTTKEVGKGTGLGLAISYGIVKEYNGKIDIKSRVGEGTTFTLCFPILHREIRNGR